MPESYIQSLVKQDEVFIGHFQGRFYAMYIDSFDNNKLSAWVLEEDGSKEQWILKHTASISELFGRKRRKKYEFYTVIAVHPEHNLIFLTGGGAGGLYDGHKLFSYDMDYGKVRANARILP
jgi:hypothetical protein